jgi:hypothetical protein
MSRITRDSFVQDMTGGAAGEEPGIDVGNLASKTEAALARAGLDRADLGEIAGEDGVIRGEDEMSKLFDLVDTRDRDGSDESIATTRKDGSGTRSGALFDALKGELERARLGAPALGGQPAKAEGVPKKTENKHASEFEPKDRATDGQRDKAMAKLEAEGFTDIHLPDNGAYFAQVDKGRWATYEYPKQGQEPGPERTLASAGCAPSSLAIADATLRGTRTTPPEVADYAVKHGSSGDPKSQGTDTGAMVKRWAKEHDLDLNVTKDVDALRDGLADGGVALVSVKGGIFSPGGHVIAVNGYAKDKDGNEWFFVANPGKQSAKTIPGEGGEPPQLVVDKDLHHGAGRVRVSKEALIEHMRKAYVLSNPD